MSQIRLQELLNAAIQRYRGGRWVEAGNLFQEVVARDPRHAEAFSFLGRALQQQRRLDEALIAFNQSLALQPNSPETYNDLAGVLSTMGQIDECVAALRQAVLLRPNGPRLHSNLVFALNYSANADARMIADEQRLWNTRHAEPLSGLIRPHPNSKDPDRRLRIGYVSSDFKQHPCAYFLVPLIEQHNFDQVELFCYADVPSPDDITRRLQKRVTQWRNTSGITDEALAEQIRDDRVDILVDLKLHTGNNRLLVFARKPAPIQVTWLGYPGSTGLSAIDYRLSDPYLDPPGLDETIYSEQTIRLPDCFWCYDPLDERAIRVNGLPALSSNIVTFGCLNSFHKVNEGTLAVWAQVIHRIPNSRLLLMALPGSHRQRARLQLERAGIAPARVEFIERQPRQKYMETYHRIDLALDTFPYNGHTTTLDALWMGVPVVTLIGNTIVGRAGHSHFCNLGVAELAATSPEQFVTIAASLAADLPKLQHLRSTLRKRMQESPLMDAARFARNIETAYRQMWKHWCAPALKP